MLFEGGIKVPFFITWPNNIKGNQHYNKVISSLDLFPTFLNAAGANAKKESQLDGVDLIPYINNTKKDNPHETLFWRSSGNFEYAVRKGNYKLYKSAYKNRTLLFNLEKDSLERFDIAKNNPKIVNDLEATYKKWDSKNIAPKWFDPHAENVIKEEKRWEKTRRKSIKSN